MSDELRKMLEAMGIDPDRFAATEPADVQKAVEALQKAGEAEDGDDEDGERNIALRALDILQGLLGTAKVRVDKAAGDEKPQPPPEDPRVEELQKRLDEQEKQLAAEREQARVEKAVTALDAAVLAKRMLPATRDALRPIAEHLARAEVVHLSKADDGTDVQTPMLDVLVKAVEHDARVTQSLFREIGMTGGDGSAADAWADFKPVGAPATGADNGSDGK